MSLSEEVIKTQIKNEMVTEVRRLQSSKNGRKEDSTTVVLTFNCKNLPEHIKLDIYAIRFVRM